MLTVHHLNNSRSQRVLWLLEELERPVRDRQATSAIRRRCSRRPSCAKIHPLGKSPVVTDGGKTLAESGAILEYLVETYGNGRLAPAARHAGRTTRYRYFLHYAEGSLMPLLLMKLVFSRMPPGAVLRAADREGDRGQGRRRASSTRTSRATSRSSTASSRSRTWFAGAS